MLFWFISTVVFFSGRIVPSLVSASRAEFTRVAMLMGRTPWRNNSDFMEQGKAHVSDMHALQYLYSQNAVLSGAHGCGAYGAEKIFVHNPNQHHNDPCATCKISNGGPIAVHFSHRSMQEMSKSNVRLRRGLQLECLGDHAKNSNWNQQRAACLVEASRALLNVCSGVAAHHVKYTAVEKKGLECHSECGGSAGMCAGVCGQGGACCRHGFEDSMDLEECGFGTLGVEGQGHMCVVAEKKA